MTRVSVDIVVIIKHETDNAWLLDHGETEPVWIPKSQAGLDLNSDGKSHTLTVPQWLAEEKGMV